MTKTVTHEGKVYEIGKLYEFSDSDTLKRYGRLESVVNDTYPYCDHDGCEWEHIKEIGASDLGKIKDAPIELIGGQAYMFDCKESLNLVGVCDIVGGIFRTHAGWEDIDQCTNIRKMVVEA